MVVASVGCKKVVGLGEDMVREKVDGKRVIGEVVEGR